MLRIQRSEDQGLATFSVSGRIGELQVSELQHVLDAEGARTALDLEEVKLAGREAIRFLAGCEARGIQLKNCPSYIREWIGIGSYAIDEIRCGATPERDS
jgi:hypothetical protein